MNVLHLYHASPIASLVYLSILPYTQYHLMSVIALLLIIVYIDKYSDMV